MRTRSERERTIREAVERIQHIALDQKSIATMIRVVSESAVDCEGVEPTASDVWEGLAVIARLMSRELSNISDLTCVVMNTQYRKRGER